MFAEPGVGAAEQNHEAHRAAGLIVPPEVGLIRLELPQSSLRCLSPSFCVGTSSLHSFSPVKVTVVSGRLFSPVGGGSVVAAGGAVLPDAVRGFGR